MKIEEVLAAMETGQTVYGICGPNPTIVVKPGKIGSIGYEQDSGWRAGFGSAKRPFPIEKIFADCREACVHAAEIMIDRGMAHETAEVPNGAK